MGTTALRQLLKSLCSNSPWNYALLWKLTYGCPMVLTWEDGCFDFPKPREREEDTLGDGVFDGGNYVLSSQFEASAANDSSYGGTTVGLVVAELPNLQYAFGDGVVGKVALTGEYCWVSFNKIFSDGLGLELLPECPEEWLLQFASGIKTILLVPVLPHGVLQLGSLNEVSEDIGMVSSLKARFLGHQSAGDNSLPFTSNKDFKTQLSPLQMPSSTNMSMAAAAFSPVTSEDSNHSAAVDTIKPKRDSLFNSLPSVPINPVKHVDSNHSLTANAIKIEENSSSTLSQVIPFSTAQHELWLHRNDQPKSFKYEREANTQFTSIGLTEGSSPDEPLNSSELEIMENKLIELSCLLEELQTYTNSNDQSLQGSGGQYHGIMKAYQAGDVAGRSYPSIEAVNVDCENVLSFVNFPEDGELHKALGPGCFQNQTFEKLSGSSLMVGDTHSSSSLTRDTDLSSRNDPSYLLEAIVANAYSSPDNSSFDRSDSSKSVTTSPGPFFDASQPQNQFGPSATIGDDTVSRKNVISACIAGGINFNSGSAAFKSVTFDREHNGKCYNNVLPCKGTRTLNASKRRARPGDNQKPRPRDRQLIQERVKELRELVPNGSKCSIDGLLDRTVKHMLYLKSVTNQAEKLKQLAVREVTPSDDVVSLEDKGSCQNTSWALECGNEFNFCPILVEDLPCPGHMLIEMVCSEHALFLDVAQVIRSLDLTILKGVTETRSNNIWAKFIVEASKGFHRLDIFWPLMQLLQRKRNSISSKI